MRRACHPVLLIATSALLAASPAPASHWAPSEGALPPGLLAGQPMDAKAGDVDGDGDGRAELFLAMRAAHVLLLSR
ncbi:MAG: hypothetical protein ACK5VV_13590 [Lysobacteraceae bacterium]|jgi:hypothetical protein|nr:hypothetical protein [Silanimonas sp.]